MAVELELTGKIALVTGAGSGIGRAAAHALAARGAAIVLSDRPGRANATAQVAGEIAVAGGEADCIELDVTDAESVSAAFDWLFDRNGRLDMLVNNAGTQLLKPALEIEAEEFDAVVAVNLRGAFLCCQEAARIMQDHGGGAIVNVASQHGVVGNRNRAAYCASKAGLINLTRALAIEWAPLGIRVNAVSPTFVATESNAHLLRNPPISDEITYDLPLGRAVTTSEVAAAICFLLEKKSTGITGHNLMVDGGWTAR